MSDQVCRGCSLPIVQRGSGRRREWCSDRCRKQTLYSKPCIDCGKMLNGSGGFDGPERCLSCANAKAGRDRSSPRYEKVQQMRAQGLQNKEIAKRLGTTRAAIGSLVCYARDQGWEIARTTYPPAAGHRTMR